MAEQHSSILETQNFYCAEPPTKSSPIKNKEASLFYDYSNYLKITIGLSLVSIFLATFGLIVAVIPLPTASIINRRVMAAPGRANNRNLAVFERFNNHILPAIRNAHAPVPPANVVPHRTAPFRQMHRQAIGS